MTPGEFKTIRKSLGLSVTQMAEALRVESERTIRRYEAGTHTITGPVSLLLEIFRDFEQEYDMHHFLAQYLKKYERKHETL